MPIVGPGNFEKQSANSQYYSQVMDLGAVHSERIEKYQTCWDFWNGDQWGVKAPEGFDQITINYCKTFVKKIRRFAFRNDWTISVPNEAKTDIDEYIQYVWNINGLHSLTNELATNGGIFGDWFLYVQWVPQNEKTGSKGYIKLVSLDPRFVFPEYNNLTGEMETCVLIVPHVVRRFDAVNNTISGVVELYREIHTPTMIYTQTTDVNGRETGYNEYVNPFGKINIIHGINYPIPNGTFGYSDIEDLIDLQKMLNKKVSNVSDIIDYHAAPITLIYGAKARELDKGANKVWSGLPSNAKVENLKSEGNVEASMSFINFIKSALHDISNIPEDSLGKGREISNTSAVALSIDFEPLIELAEDKRYYFSLGIHDINELIIDMKEYYNDSVDEVMVKKYEHMIEFGPLLPRDRQADLRDVETELRLGLEVPRGALVRLGEPDPDKKLREIEEYEQKKMIKEQERLELMQDAKVDGNDIKDQKEATKAVNKTPETHGEQVVEDNVRQKS